MSWVRCSRSSPSPWPSKTTPSIWTRSFQIGQGYKIGKYTIHEAEHMPATLAARDILAQSSNIGTAQIALRSGGVQAEAIPDPHWACSTPVQTELPEHAPAALSRQLGHHRNRHHRLRPGHFGEPACASSASAAAIVNGGREITPTFIKTDADRRGAQLIKPEDQRARCAACCAMS